MKNYHFRELVEKNERIKQKKILKDTNSSRVIVRGKEGLGGRGGQREGYMAIEGDLNWVGELTVQYTDEVL